MKLLIIALHAVTTLFLVSGQDTTACLEWCEAKDVGKRETAKCATNCENRRTKCKNLCALILNKTKQKIACQENCMCVDKAAKVLDLLKTNRQEVFKQFSQNSDSCDDSE